MINYLVPALPRLFLSLSHAKTRCYSDSQQNSCKARESGPEDDIVTILMDSKLRNQFPTRGLSFTHGQ